MGDLRWFSLTCPARNRQTTGPSGTGTDLVGRLPAIRHRASMSAMHRLDPYRCTNLLIERHGADAEIHAAMRADELDAEGDDAGQSAWMRTLAALGDLRRTTPTHGERIQ